jgi:hypothetical protein
MAEEVAVKHSNPDTKPNQINVSTKKNPNFYVFLGKKYLEENGVKMFSCASAVSLTRASA